ncbi:polysaccharide deacetylase family protein [Elongatibacter sediminis]|uniref:Polysaccharide deacetylase family protein n=1 Tax=Elongatibacter sediminis TaxID=3119006 RepID=A0AAW9REZ2_9GAMM
MLKVPILTYHSQNVQGESTADNDHAALATDLPAIYAAGFRVVPLDRLVDALDRGKAPRELKRAVVLSFDDGCDFDVRDIDYPGHGMQRAFAAILKGVRQAVPPARDLHATTFVIASSEARQSIDAGSLFGHGWISDDWWEATDRGGLIAVENHGWDHNHPDLEGDDRGSFHAVDTHEQCLEQVVRAAGTIAARTGRWPRYFAYPFGESSRYIRETFFPEFPAVHGCRAALGTDPGPVTAKSNRWDLPRYVCGRDWTTPDELIALLKN